MSSRRCPSRLRRIVRMAEERGWSLRYSHEGHVRLVPPPGTQLKPVSFASTPQDWRSDLNQISMLRRQGVPVPYRGGR